MQVQRTETIIEIRQDDDEELNPGQRDDLVAQALEYYRFRLDVHGDGRLAHRDAEYYLVSQPTRETELDLSAGGSDLTYEVAYDALLGIELFFHLYPANRGAIVTIIKNPTISGIDPETGELEPIGYVILRRNEESFAVGKVMTS